MIYDYKEVAFQKYQLTRLLADFAEKAGFQVDHVIAGDNTAIVATFAQENGPVVSFNAVTWMFSKKVNAESKNMMYSLV